jgi:hypothetical protein
MSPLVPITLRTYSRGGSGHLPRWCSHVREPLEERIMTTREKLLKKLEERKANRENEIQQIPIARIRKMYQRKLGSDEKMQEIFSKSGDYFTKYWNNPLSRPVLHLLYSLIMPWVFKKQFQLGDKPRDFFDSVVDYGMFATSYGAGPFEIEEVTEDRVVAYVNECPMRFDKHHKLCLALTSMEPRLSKKPYFGAKIIYTERIPEGAKRCTVVFERK